MVKLGDLRYCVVSGMVVSEGGFGLDKVFVVVLERV